LFELVLALRVYLLIENRLAKVCAAGPFENHSTIRRSLVHHGVAVVRLYVVMHPEFAQADFCLAQSGREVCAIVRLSIPSRAFTPDMRNTVAILVARLKWLGAELNT